MPPSPPPAARRRRPSITETLTTAASTIESKASAALTLLWDDLPQWRRDNAYILSGYRHTSNSYLTSFASVLHLHNESVNIWTHLLGAVGFSAAGLVLYRAAAARYQSATDADCLVFACFFAGAFLCLGMSATYHTLTNHSPAVAKWGNKLDYTGIVLLIVGSYVPAMYYGLFCHPDLMTCGLSMIALLGLGCLTVSWLDTFRTPAWRPYRALMFVGLGLSGVVPILYMLATDSTYSELNERMGLNWVILQGAMYIFGAFLYAARWPERRWPGAFDIWGSSHQIFHVFVVLAAASHLIGMIKAFDFHHTGLGSQC
ncbi:hemolysin-III related-domain-containing protein [Podospora conica]|nr:hemolysin-III related-domain-containing protein [Schizothecium conicum]